MGVNSARANTLTAQAVVHMEGSFDVHSDVVQQTIKNKLPDDVRTTAVGIELHAESHVVNHGGEFRKVSLKCRFTGDVTTSEINIDFT